ncbi:hypothetical protein SADUNF_Sadunf12G0075200 [Salix dunnii]|uniref:Uncharacterized protein n=1 Tax=Salix dunnii TaxID=1413687 RepID=A0A835MPJ8_9ROSI|nr:hypothetical protein SADUNF_Sadunf12G0075200 [Salix dunnii]
MQCFTTAVVVIKCNLLFNARGSESKRHLMGWYQWLNFLPTIYPLELSQASQMSPISSPCRVLWPGKI